MDAGGLDAGLRHERPGRLTQEPGVLETGAVVRVGLLPDGAQLGAPPQQGAGLLGSLEPLGGVGGALEVLARLVHPPPIQLRLRERAGGLQDSRVLLEIRQHVDEDLPQIQDPVGTARRLGQVDGGLQHLGGLQEAARGPQGVGERAEDVQGPRPQVRGEQEVGGLPVLGDRLVVLVVLPGEPAEHHPALDDGGQRRRVVPAQERVRLAGRLVDVADVNAKERGEAVDAVAQGPVGVLARTAQTVGDNPEDLGDRQRGRDAEQLGASTSLPVEHVEELPQVVGGGHRARARGRARARLGRPGG